MTNGDDIKRDILKILNFTKYYNHEKRCCISRLIGLDVYGVLHHIMIREIGSRNIYKKKGEKFFKGREQGAPAT